MDVNAKKTNTIIEKSKSLLTVSDEKNIRLLSDELPSVLEYLEAYKNMSDDAIKYIIRVCTQKYTVSAVSSATQININTIYGYTRENAHRPPFESFIKFMVMYKALEKEGKRCR